MKSDIDEVALQGIEFWSNVCDEEMDLAIEASEVNVKLCSRVSMSSVPPDLNTRVLRPTAGVGAGPSPGAHQ